MQYLDMFEAYVKERENGELLRHPHGFAIYLDIDQDTAYLQDVYVQPEHRTIGVGRELLGMAVQKAKKSNKNTLLTSTDISTHGVEVSMLSILASGFKVKNLEQNMIWYSMELTHG